ncbi:M48 family metallopeptidase [Psittacicella hinzii]|uniref:Peptidase M48 domain-containing protein n=1 Tax=Psittacicella hinzii TaxID=2028575 RepID=A0A3A1YF50_9GAMM|nr:M48 family metallopeptidase [Psittacicella hinzii]RIY34854.1 hypothetical protein CKF58_07545 [Psittacicella hinzii]
MITLFKRCYCQTIVVGSLALASCSVVTNIVAPSSTEMNALSAQQYTQLVTENQKAVDRSSATYRRINAIFKRMIPFANKLNKTGTEFEWQLTVFKSNTVNAFAMPGGKIAFYTGLVENLKLTDDEIAAVMGHEMIHALNEHSRKAYAGQLVTNGALAIGSVAVGVASGVDPNSLYSLSSAIGAVGITLPYSRSNETEADVEGLYLMAQTGYDPRASLTLWKKMAAYSEKLGAEKTANIFSTHPTDEKRYATLSEHMEKALELYRQAKKAK